MYIEGVGPQRALVHFSFFVFFSVSFEVLLPSFILFFFFFFPIFDEIEAEIQTRRFFFFGQIINVSQLACE